MVNKGTVIMGDSNLNRIPAVTQDVLQMDSFPGASFYHAAAILRKKRRDTTVRKLVLSLGINKKSQHSQKMAIKQLQGMFTAAKEAFPTAKIWIPLSTVHRAWTHN